MQVCVRKRPIFPHEIAASEFDVITCCNNTCNNNNRNVKKNIMQTTVIHDARMHSDMKRMFIDHHNFVFHRVFDEKTGNGEVNY